MKPALDERMTMWKRVLRLICRAPAAGFHRLDRAGRPLRYVASQQPRMVGLSHSAGQPQRTSRLPARDLLVRSIAHDGDSLERAAVLDPSLIEYAASLPDDTSSARAARNIPATFADLCHDIWPPPQDGLLGAC